MPSVGLDHVSTEVSSAPVAPEFPVLVRRTFPGQPGQVRIVRWWLNTQVGGPAGTDDVVLACSELVANAIIHSSSGLPGGVFTVRLAIDRDFVRVEVIDQGGQWPGVSRPCHDPADDAEDVSQCGRGLRIIAALASAWGITGDQEGRTAWCEIKAELCQLTNARRAAGSVSQTPMIQEIKFPIQCRRLSATGEYQSRSR
jgi:anti-sigma regulatory factor (Ser/Thr protein kinase)